MRTARSTSLLEFAIAASLAIVPILFGVVLLVAGVFPADADSRARRGAADRYVSVRHVAALKTFEAAVVERSAAVLSAPTAQQVLGGLPACRAEWGVAWRARDAASWLAGAAAPPSPADQIAAQLVEFDAALGRFSVRGNARVGQPVGFDAARWFAAAGAALAAPIESAGYPGQVFALRCTDLAAGLAALLRDDARMLDALAWRGTESSTVLARWSAGQQVEIAPYQVTRRNPWSGVAGCIYLGRDGDGATAGSTHFVAGPRSVQGRLCAAPALVGVGGATARAAPTAPPIALAGEPGPADAPDDSRWMVPPSLHAMLAPLETLRQPTGALYRLYTDSADTAAEPGSPRRAGSNRIVLDGSPVDIGLSIALTIDPALQSLAQRTAACYTGRHEVCAALGLRRQEDKSQPIGQAMLEGAMVRMAAVAVIDVASGRIEALAGALSRCARQAVDGPGRDAACDARLPYPVQYRPDALLNPAVFHDAMPASTVKPIMAAAFLSDPVVGARWLAAEQAAMQREAEQAAVRRGGPQAAMGRDPGPARQSLRGQLLRSDSARFLDRMFCLDQGVTHCDRPWAVQDAAAAFGWNAGCDDAFSPATALGRAGPLAVRRADARPERGESAGRDCGKRDLLFGGALEAPREAPSAWAPARPAPKPMAVAYGRLMTQPPGDRLGAPMQLRPRSTLSAAILRRCAAGADGRRLSDDDWEKCRGGAVVDVVAEGWGQGHARASALGIAGMMATLASAANGQTELRRPHLVESVRGIEVAQGTAAAAVALRTAHTAAIATTAIPDSLASTASPARPASPDTTPLGAALGQWREGALQSNRLAPVAAEVILSGLAHSHRIGTARTACEQVFDAKRCRDIAWLAGKTGTPSFPNDGVSLDELARLCPRGLNAGHPAGRPAALPTAAAAPACSSLRPYKWYVAAYRSDGAASGPWTKVIAVLTERNWVQRSGQVHGAGDHGPNPSAEIALQIAGRQLGLLAGAAP